ncbi:hypothetical protein OG455_24795 [Kitasatospora sp. NBC_01287]|uniref:hypothetical protein n=1 Tax=Kitasatospora sp. NBC_01287 TaxID=2903573 RepID=UPI0022539AB0|nr:hypothetical protein [Kitasatospora sp. NBC_01287]MCX4748698.1 hypothetical protein [Kitasatospora sp. NBC_01287]
MSGTEEELTVRLARLADGEAPHSTVSAGAAIRMGRSRRVRRRLSAVGAVTAVAVAATGLVTALPEPRHGTVTGSAAGGTTVQAAGDIASDPLVSHAEFGWLPTQFAGLSYQASPANPTGDTPQFTRANGKHGDDGFTTMLLWLTVYGKGATPPLRSTDSREGPAQHLVASPPVHGHPAYFLASQDGTPGPHELCWQLADGRWVGVDAELTAASAQSDFVKVVADLPRIAAGVSVDERAVPLPFRINGLPDNLRLSAATLDHDSVATPGSWAAGVNYNVAGTKDHLVVTVEPEGSADPGSQVAVAGFPVQPDPSLLCVVSHGLKACATSPQGSSAFDAVGGEQAFLNRFTLLGTNEKAWTAQVLGK